MSRKICFASMPPRLARFAIGAVLGALMVVAGGTAEADAVKTRAWAHDGFGRIVFEWDSAVGHTIRLNGDKLVVEFDRPMEGSLESVAARLSDYVSASALEEGGRRAVFTLTRPVTPVDRSDGNVVVVDLTAGGSADAPAASSPSAPGAQDSASERVLNVRAGEHGDFARLVFDWTLPVEYTASQTGDQLRLDFDHKARVDLSAIRADLPPFVTAVDAAQGPRGLSVTLTVVPGARPRHFRSETKVVVDVLGPVGAELATRDLGPAGGPS
ncbi:MAG: hypothetical protein WCF16_11230, partial [Alphaproteobacteria bacterium]